MSQQITEKSKKNEILAAYGELMKQLEERERGRSAVLPVHDEKKKQVEAMVKKTENYSVASALKEIEDCRKNFADKADTLEESLTTALRSLAQELEAELNKLQDVRSVISAEQHKLENFYGIKNTAISLQEFLQMQEEQKKAWKLEQEEYAKIRQREEEEYFYSLKLKRKKEQDEYADQQNSIRALFEEEMRLKKEEINQREQLLKAQLIELEELRKFKQQAEVLKEKAVQENLGKQQKDLQKDFDTRFTLENQKHNAEKDLLEHKIKTLDEQVAHYFSELNLFKKDLRTANDKAQELALSIIQSQKKEVKMSEAGDKGKE